MIAAAETKRDTAMTLRRARAGDREAILQMYISFEPKGAALGLPPARDPGKWIDSLADYPNYAVFAEGSVVGHGVLCPTEDSGEVAVFVHQDCRGRGIGKLLLAALIGEAKRLGLRRMWGMADEDNLAMLRLAASCGFQRGPGSGEFELLLERNDEKLAIHKPAA